MITAKGGEVSEALVGQGTAGGWGGARHGVRCRREGLSWSGESKGKRGGGV
jgi:hypothetical protein